MTLQKDSETYLLGGQPSRHCDGLDGFEGFDPAPIAITPIQNHKFFDEILPLIAMDARGTSTSQGETQIGEFDFREVGSDIAQDVSDAFQKLSDYLSDRQQGTDAVHADTSMFDEYDMQSAQRDYGLSM